MRDAPIRDCLCTQAFGLGIRPHFRPVTHALMIPFPLRHLERTLSAKAMDGFLVVGRYRYEPQLVS